MTQDFLTPVLQFLEVSGSLLTDLNLGALPKNKIKVCERFYIFIAKAFLLHDFCQWGVHFFPAREAFLSICGSQYKHKRRLQGVQGLS